jgi:hypothetical protein
LHFNNRPFPQQTKNAIWSRLHSASDSHHLLIRRNNYIVFVLKRTTSLRSDTEKCTDVRDSRSESRCRSLSLRIHLKNASDTTMQHYYSHFHETTITNVSMNFEVGIISVGDIKNDLQFAPRSSKTSNRRQQKNIQTSKILSFTQSIIRTGTTLQCQVSNPGLRPLFSYSPISTTTAAIASSRIFIPLSAMTFHPNSYYLSEGVHSIRASYSTAPNASI